MIRAAKRGEEADIAAFLSHHAETTMFLCSGLAWFGLSRSEHPHANTF